MDTQAASRQQLIDNIIQALQTVYDPELPANIYDLGLIYRLQVNQDGQVELQMTLTAPGCPVAATFPDTVRAAVQGVAGVTDVKVSLVWEPPWSPDMMSERARIEMDMDMY